MFLDETENEKLHTQLLDNEPYIFRLGAGAAALTLLRRFVLDPFLKTEELDVISVLGVRLINLLGASWKLAGSGYYGPAATLLRDIAETSILLDYFSCYPEKIQEWKSAVGEDRRKFRTAALDNVLVNSHKRQTVWGEKFKFYSEMFSHPTSLGVLSITSESGRENGPHFDEHKFSMLTKQLSIDIVEATAIFIDALQKITGAKYFNAFRDELLAFEFVRLNLEPDLFS